MRQRDNDDWEPHHRASVRHRVAVEAARLLYHREIREYLHAKREAARRQGTVHLPSNWEVHEQLLLIARDVEGDEHARRLHQMRSAAVALMESLEAFSPRLIGSVLTGHIRKGSDIDIHVYTDDLDALGRALGAQGLAFEVEVVTTHKQGDARDFVHVRLPDLRGFEVEITVHPPESLRVPMRCGITGGAMRRAGAAEVRALLHEEPCPTPVAGWIGFTRPLSRDEVLSRIPELAACRGVLQDDRHHLDVLEHTWTVMEGLERVIDSGYARFGTHAAALGRHLQASSDQALLLLAGACHDLGKPACRSVDRKGRVRFPGHARQSADVARGIASRLGLDGTTARELGFVVELHFEAVLIPREGGEPSRIRRMLAGAGRRLPELALLSMCDVDAARGPASGASTVEEHGRFVEFLLAQFFEHGFLAHPVLPLAVAEIVEQYGPTDAATLDRLRDLLLDAYVDGEFEGREDGLELAGELLAASWER